MATVNSIPVQRITEIDEKARAAVTGGIQTTLAALLSHLRAIKDTEHKWLMLFLTIMLAATGILTTVRDDHPVWGWPLIVVFLGSFALTVWQQYAQFCERRSYYGVMRTVVRAQNLLGLYELRLLSPHLAASAFPAGFGPYPEVNGTRPESSFLRRQFLTFILFAFLLGTSAVRGQFHWLFRGTAVALLLLVDVAFLYWLFRRDLRDMQRAMWRERDLAGADPTWFPPTPLV